jgi:hypothetical protein
VPHKNLKTCLNLGNEGEECEDDELRTGIELAFTVFPDYEVFAEQAEEAFDLPAF